MTHRPYGGVFLTRQLTLVAVLVGLVAVLCATAVWWWVNADGRTNSADRIGAIVAVVGLVAAVGAVVVALLTIRQQQIESRRQRQMETLHRVNEQYEKIFDDIYDLRAKTAGPDHAFDENDMRRMYNRFFTALMTGFRYYRLDLIPREDFQEWTATLIGRFAKQECIVRAAAMDPCPLVAHWEEFNSWARGPRTAFRAYMNTVQAHAKAIRALPAPERDAALLQAAGATVDAIPVSD